MYHLAVATATVGVPEQPETPRKGAHLWLFAYLSGSYLSGSGSSAATMG
jgi:hypothetical protein